MPRTPPFQGERLYTQDELPDVDEIDWQSGEDFVFNLPGILLRINQQFSFADYT